MTGSSTDLSSLIHLLGELLGEVIGEQESPAVFDAEERIRALAKARRAGEAAGKEMGLDLRGIPTGGGSDGNHTWQLAPTIDGLGPQGTFAHSPDEYIELPTLIERAKVNARFIELWTERFRG